MKRILQVIFAAMVVAALSFPALSASGASVRVDSHRGSPASTMRPDNPCGAFGFVVWMVYAKLDQTPAGNSCWTLIRPVTADKSTYTTCDVSAASPHIIENSPPGSSWVYDDTNTSGHNGNSDQWWDNNLCGSRTSWWGEFMAANGGYHWAWNVTHLFEENYSSSQSYISYTTSISQDPGTSGSGSNFAPIPTINAVDPSAVSHIESNCYRSPWTPQGNYFFGIYNGTEISQSTVQAIENALTFCFS